MAAAAGGEAGASRFGGMSEKVVHALEAVAARPAAAAAAAVAATATVAAAGAAVLAASESSALATGYVEGGGETVKVDREVHAGELSGKVFRAHGVKFAFCLAGGHIAPILTGCEAEGIRVIAVRHEVNAVFAADAVARVTGMPGIACVTAGPGVANAVTALKNAQLAQSPLVLCGGATSALLKGRGSLQDIDQHAMIRPHVKTYELVSKTSEIVPALERALRSAMSGTPGPVFVEFPLDLLYSETDATKTMMPFRIKTRPEDGVLSTRAVMARATNWYFDRHLSTTFDLSYGQPAGEGSDVLIRQPRSPTADKNAFPELWRFYDIPRATDAAVRAAAARLRTAKRPVLVLGAQSVCDVNRLDDLAAAVLRIGAPVFLGGAARGLMGRDCPLQYRHERSRALAEADVVVLGGVTNDFRMKYGQAVSQRAHLISANRSKADLYLNRSPSQAVLADAADFVIRVSVELAAMRGEVGDAAAVPAAAPASAAAAAASTSTSSLPTAAAGAGAARYPDWHAVCQERELARDDKILADGDRVSRAILDLPADATPVFGEELINPIRLALELEKVVPDNAIFVADGGDIVATAAYCLRGRGPLSWLDPGPFGTLGVGFGFALGAALACPDKEVWCIFGDGAIGFSMMEIDTLVRYGVKVIAVVGNDGCWTQIQRDQIKLLKRDTACMLTRSHYNEVAASLGAHGLEVGGNSPGAASADAAGTPADGNSAAVVNETLLEARRLYADGDRPVVVNALIGSSDFREGSISM